MKILISSDSTADIAKELLDTYSIALAPLIVQIETESFHDGIDLTAQDIFTASESGKNVRTAAINTYEYIDFFREQLTHCDELIHFTIGSEFSACYQNALLAAKKVEHVHVVNTQSLSCGSGIMVYEAAQMAAAGHSVEEILAHSAEIEPLIDGSFVVESIDYLHRGGRCSAVAALGAKMLQLKPCIELLHGKLTVGRKYRGTMHMCLKHYVNDRLVNLEDLDPSAIFLVSTPGSAELAAPVYEELKALGYFEKIIVSEAGCTICTHCGPNTLGIMYKRKTPKAAG